MIVNGKITSILALGVGFKITEGKDRAAVRLKVLSLSHVEIKSS